MPGAQSPPLGLYLKLSRARKHLRHLRRIIEKWKASDPYALNRQVDAEGKYYLYSFQVVPAPDIILLLTDEAIHHLRTVLDHLIIATVESVGEKVTYAHAFPIWREEPKKPDDIARYNAMVDHIPGQARVLIDNVQPYKRGTDAKSHPLAILARLDNRFKHASLHLLTSQVQMRPVPGIIQPPAPPYGRDSGDVFAKVPISIDVEKDFEPYVSVRVAISISVTGMPNITLEMIDAIYNYVRDEVIRKAVRFKRARLPRRL